MNGIQSFQDRVLNQINDRLHCDAGLETSINYDFANTGSLYGHRKGAIRPLVTVGFSFQPGSYTLTLTVGMRRIPSQEGRADYFDFHYPQATDKTRFWECLAAELKKIDDAEFNAIKAKYERADKN